jgi:hypothetical protein
VPVPDLSIVFLQLRRHGAPPDGYGAGEEVADFSVPVSEVDAILTLLGGIVTQARRDGVLHAAAAASRQERETGPDVSA